METFFLTKSPLEGKRRQRKRKKVRKEEKYGEKNMSAVQFSFISFRTVNIISCAHAPNKTPEKLH